MSDRQETNDSLVAGAALGIVARLTMGLAAVPALPV
jgi:hypothetical protein